MGKVVTFKPLTGKAIKRCVGCGELKPWAAYCRDISNKDGLRRYCRPCSKAQQAATQQAKRDGIVRPRGKPPTNPKPKVEATPRRHAGSIVDFARHVVAESGYPPRHLAIMPLDDLMREANRLLHAAGQEQLGKKPNWLHE